MKSRIYRPKSKTILHRATLLEASLDLMAKYNKAYAGLDQGSSKDIDKKDLSVMREIVSQGHNGFGNLDKNGVLNKTGADSTDASQPLSADPSAPSAITPESKQKLKMIQDHLPPEKLPEGQAGYSELQDKQGKRIGIFERATPAESKSGGAFKVSIGGQPGKGFDRSYVFDKDGNLLCVKPINDDSSPVQPVTEQELKDLNQRLGRPQRQPRSGPAAPRRSKGRTNRLPSSFRRALSKARQPR